MRNESWLSLSFLDLHRLRNEGTAKSPPSAPCALLDDFHVVLPSWTKCMVSSERLVTSVAPNLFLFRMSFSFLEGFKLAFGLHKSIWKKSEEMAQFRWSEVLAQCLPASYSDVSRAALQHRWPSNRMLLNFSATFSLSLRILRCPCWLAHRFLGGSLMVL